ncbi:hypothetical protein C8R45DRAFT_173875 [Mycena sanguinolenta]|nr:hypothetical protein C8R45DRAFT_173875 [Mycena sanguinolenta]
MPSTQAAGRAPSSLAVVLPPAPALRLPHLPGLGRANVGRPLRSRFSRSRLDFDSPPASSTPRASSARSAFDGNTDSEELCTPYMQERMGKRYSGSGSARVVEGVLVSESWRAVSRMKEIQWEDVAFLRVAHCCFSYARRYRPLLSRPVLLLGRGWRDAHTLRSARHRIRILFFVFFFLTEWTGLRASRRLYTKSVTLERG